MTTEVYRHRWIANASDAELARWLERLESLRPSDPHERDNVQHLAALIRVEQLQRQPSVRAGL